MEQEMLIESVQRHCILFDVPSSDYRNSEKKETA